MQKLLQHWTDDYLELVIIPCILKLVLWNIYQDEHSPTKATPMFQNIQHKLNFAPIRIGHTCGQI